MAEKVLTTRIQLRYDSYENWVGSDPVLKAGEMALTSIPQTGSGSDQHTQPPAIMAKVGNGTAKYSELPWESALAADVYAWAKSATFGAAVTLTSSGTGDFVKNVTISGNTITLTKGNPASTTAKVLNTTATTAQTTAASEAILGSGTITLHKIAKTGTYSDLIGKPTLGTAAAKDADAFETAGAAAAVLGTSSDTSDKATVYGAKAAAAAAQSTANGKYSKPSGGIPKTDLASAVQTSLGKADSAVQSVVTGSTNGTVSVDGTDVAVKGLGDLAYKSSLSKSDVGLGSVVNAGRDTTPTANSNNYITSGGVKTYVDNAISGVTQFDIIAVADFASLPTTGKKGVIYLVPHSHGTSDSYDEYIWNTALTTPAYEKIGNTDVNLSGYVPTSRTIAGKNLAADISAADMRTALNVADGATKVTTDTVSGWGYTKNTGTVTGVKVNGTTKSPSSGVVDIGTVLTSHQDISGKQDKLTFDGTYDASTNKAATVSSITSRIPTALKNPNALTIAGLTYDGSVARSIIVDGTYNASTNKVATQSTVSSAVNAAKNTFKAGTGLTASVSGTEVTYSFDDSVTFVFDCGGAS